MVRIAAPLLLERYAREEGAYVTRWAGHYVPPFLLVLTMKLLRQGYMFVHPQKGEDPVCLFA